MGQVVKKPKFKPRRLDDEMPPLRPIAIRVGGENPPPWAWGAIRNCRIEGFGTGISVEGMHGLIIENLTTRGTLRPLSIKMARKAYLRGLDFQR